MSFLSSLDIANRALQHCGATRIDPTLGFTEPSTNASETSFAYDKLRKAELRRNVWAFATRKAILRAIDSNTLLLVPTLWVSASIYFVGSIVADQFGQLWQSTVASNTGNDPLNSTGSWQEYFGPLTVQLYNPNLGYNAGELVYTVGTGDSNPNVYMAVVSMNNVDPSLPNQWAATTTYYRNNVVQAFPAWAVGTTYAAGATVTYTDGNTYSSLSAGNIAHTPASGSTFWALMPTLILATQTVPTTSVLQPPQSSPVTEWNIGTAYSLGSFVMFNGTEYVSIANSNTGNYPNGVTSLFWQAVTGGTLYMSLLNININNNPASAPALWATATTYTIGQTVGGSDGVIYSSLTNFNQGNNPVTDAGAHWTNTGVSNPWTTVFTQGGGNSMWTQIGGSSFPSGVTLTTLNITYPLGTGPSTQTATRNVFRLPAGYLRTAPQDPKAGSVSYLGAPTGLQYTDWNYEGNYITSWTTDPIMLRFICDTTNVVDMDDMFCEGLAARIGYEIAPRLTQSNDKQKQIIGIYQEHMSSARLVNAIETGATEPPEDDYLTTRY